MRQPAAPTCDGLTPPVAHPGSSEEQGSRLAGRYPTSLVLAMVIMDLLPGVVEFRISAGASDFLDFHERVRWLLFTRFLTSGIAFNVACLLLSLLLSLLGSPTRLACSPLPRFPKCFLFLGFLLRVLEECMGPRFLLRTIYVIYLKQAYVRVLLFSTSIYVLQRIADCFQKASQFMQFCSPRAGAERPMAKQQASRSDLKEKIRNLEDQVECLKAAVQLAEKGSSMCKICYEREVGCALEPCRHHAFCLLCSQRLADLKENCPLCRQEVTGLIQTFVS